MLKGAAKWALILAALLVVGPLAAALVSGLRDADGMHAASALLSRTPAAGLGAIAAGVLAAGAMGVLTARFFGVASGLNICGLVLIWVSWPLAMVPGAIGGLEPSAVLRRLSLEAALWGALALLIAWAITRRRAKAPGSNTPGVLGAMPAVVVGVLAGAVVAYLVAGESLKGQSIAAATLGAIAAAAGAYLTMRATHGSVPALAPFVSIVLLAVFAPWLVLLAHAKAVLPALARADTIIPLARLGPLDWLAGAFLGIPIGTGWAASMIETKQASAGPAAS